MDSYDRNIVIMVACAAVVLTAVAISYNWRMAVTEKAKYQYETAQLYSSSNTMKVHHDQD